LKGTGYTDAGTYVPLRSIGIVDPGFLPKVAFEHYQAAYLVTIYTAIWNPVPFQLPSADPEDLALTNLPVPYERRKGLEQG